MLYFYLFQFSLFDSPYVTRYIYRNLCDVVIITISDVHGVAHLLDGASCWGVRVDHLEDDTFYDCLQGIITGFGDDWYREG